MKNMKNHKYIWGPLIQFLKKRDIFIYLQPT
jgi:hypothetical protein